MRCAYSVAACDGGGGSVDFSTLLGISEVLDLNTEEQTTRVLYADTIDKTEVSTIIDNLYALTSEDGIGVTSSNLIGENDSLMSLTNSNRFYTGEVAKAQFQAMGNVNTKITDLLSKIDTIYENKEAILSKIDNYNARLKELKKNCRLTLLQKAADKWNFEKHDKEGSPERKIRSGSLNPPGPRTEWGWGDNQVVFEEGVKIRSWTDDVTGPVYRASYDLLKCEYDWHVYKIIKYWRGFRTIKWFNDPGFEEVEKMFEDVGAPLPYNPALILPKEN